MTFKIILFVILLLLSALFSGSEIVYSKVNILRLEREKDTSKSSAKALSIATNFSKSIGTILIGNNLVNVAMSALGTILSLDIAKEIGADLNVAPTIGTIIITVLVITFGEIIPKTIFQNYSYSLSKVLTLFIRFFNILFFPIVWLITKLMDIIMKPFKKIVKPDEVDEEDASDELLNMADELEDSGVLDNDDAELVRSAIEFTETVVWEIMTPRVDVIAFATDDDFDKIIEDKDFYTYSRVILYKDTIDNVVGIIDTTQILKNRLLGKEAKILDCLYEPLYVHKTMPISQALKELKESKKHLAIVLDEWGGMYGIVTIEDILEELFGEIQDEMDNEDPMYQRLSENTYLVDGDMNIYDFFDLIEFEEKDFETDYSTIGGLCTELLEKLPEVGDELDFENIHFNIEEVETHRVLKVKVTLNKIDEVNE